MATVTLKIENMSCGACVRRVTQTLNRIPETQAEEVQLGNARVRTQATTQQLLQALDAAGFPAQVDSSAA